MTDPANLCSRIGRLRERQYQLIADRRNDACIKFDNHRQTARYFERESTKAKQFNAWNVSNRRESKNLEILRKAELLKKRQSKLKDLLLKEEQIYKRECENFERKHSLKVHFSLPPKADKLRDKRHEESLDRPQTFRRIQSYYCGPHQTNLEYHRPVLKEFNKDYQRKASRMSLEKPNYNSDLCERMRNHEIMSQADTLEIAQDDYNERMDEYKENSRSARASNLYGGEIDVVKRRNDVPVKNANRPAAGLGMESEHRPRSRTLHDSHFLLGNQTCLDEEGGGNKGPNPKFIDRYSNRSLEATNVGETAAHSLEDNQSEFDEANEEIDQQFENEKRDEEKRESEDQIDGNHERAENEEEYEVENEDVGNFGSSSMKNNVSGTQQEQHFDEMMLKNERNEKEEQQREIDWEVSAKASAGRSDHRHFESEKSMPWLRMIPGDKNLSEQMFLYLSHNELKGQIQDLEKRENQASSKHQWDEALRLRDMKNRLDLAREKNLYRRDDLMLDPEVKKLGMAGIEARSKLLKAREGLCTNSSMYSEEAKVMWDQWVIEDRTSILEDARLVREDLMNQLEENWRSLAVEDKQRIADSFKDKKIHMGLEHSGTNACVGRATSP